MFFKKFPNEKSTENLSLNFTLLDCQIMRILLFFLLIFSVSSCQKNQIPAAKRLQGMAFGTTFHITMEDSDEVITEKSIDSLIHLVNRSLSTYLPASDISKINSGDTTVVLDTLFKEVFYKSRQVYLQTEGAFDPTIGILVNAWGFGPEEMVENMGQEHVDSLMQYVGYDQLAIVEGKLVKEHPQTYLDFNANAKGFGVDVIGRYLEQKGVKNYLVEIGGEIRSRGRNDKGLPWKVAIEAPNFDGTRSFQTIVPLEDESIATSGNYRKFKVDSLTGEKYAHTIDTKTGYPSKSNLLSASVIAQLDCADVDAYATALMAMGLDKSKEFLAEHPELKVFLIYADKEKLKTYKTDNLELQKP
jgi:thiamine biosynthesis lipoprotein